jgi:elongation factor Tu
MIVATPGTVKEGKEFDADITIPGKDEGGRHNPFMDQMRIQNPRFQIRTAVVSGTFQILGNTVSPNVPFPIHVKLAQSVALEVGLQVKLRNDTKVVATGVITKIGS